MRYPQAGKFLADAGNKTAFDLTTTEGKHTFFEHLTEMGEFIALHYKECQISYVLNDKGLAVMSLRTMSLRTM